MNVIDRVIRDFAVDQLNKEARGEHTYLDDVPDLQFLVKESLFYIKMADKKLNYQQNMNIARDILLTAIKMIEDLR